MMKKLICIAVIVMMLCSFALSTAALSSPAATEAPNPTSPSSSTSSSGGSSTSPKTGDPLFLILGVGVLAIGAGALAVKRIKE